MKKIIKLITFFSLVLLLMGCATKASKEFKSEYESLNGKTNSSGKAHRVVSIPKDNPFEKVSASKIVQMIENKETFYVYFGDELCPWCRSVIEKAIETAKNNKVNKIYYVKIWDKDGNEVLRSKYKLSDDGKVEELIKGKEEYYKLLQSFDSLLSDYTLADTNGNVVNTNEKRIFAPNFIYVENGVAKKLVEGISSNQKDSREDLTDEMLKDEEEIFNNFFKNN